MLRSGKIGLLLTCSVLLGLLVAACGGSDPTATPRPAATSTPAPAAATPTPRPAATNTPVPTAVPAGDLRVALSEFRFDLFPEATSWRQWLDPMWDSIVGASPAGQVDSASGVASAWQSSADFKTWTFTVRKGVVFHNGTPATSADLKWTMEFQSRQDSTASSAAEIRGLLAGVDTPDESTVIFRLTRPSFLFPAQYFSPLGAAGATSYLLPMKYMQSLAPAGSTDQTATNKAIGAAFNKSAVGSGPFKLKDVSLGNSITYEAMPNHWYYGVPKYKSVSMMKIPEETARSALLKTGKAEIIEIGRKSAADVKAQGFNIFQKAGSGFGLITLHEQYKSYGGKPNPLGNLEVRQALNMAVDRETLAKTFLFGLANPSIDYPVTSFSPAYVKQPIPKFDIAGAKALLTKAGYNGFELDVYIHPFNRLPESVEIMEAIASWWEQAGVKVVRKPREYTAVRELWFNQAFDRPSASGTLFVANALLVNATYNSKASARAVEDPELEAAGNKVAGSLNTEQYIQNLQAVQRLTHSKYVTVPLFEAGDTFAAVKTVDTRWDLGKDAYSMRINQVAGGK